MNKIKLVIIDESNFIEAFNLKLNDGQEKFVSHPIRSLAQAYVYYNQCCPFGIYLDDKMIGYVMVIYDYDLEEYNIWHMMIDKEYQHIMFDVLVVPVVTAFCFDFYRHSYPHGRSEAHGKYNIVKSLYGEVFDGNRLF